MGRSYRAVYVSPLLSGLWVSFRVHPCCEGGSWSSASWPQEGPAASRTLSGTRRRTLAAAPSMQPRTREATRGSSGSVRLGRVGVGVRALAAGGQARQWLGQGAMPPPDWMQLIPAPACRTCHLQQEFIVNLQHQPSRAGRQLRRQRRVDANHGRLGQISCGALQRGIEGMVLRNHAWVAENTSIAYEGSEGRGCYGSQCMHSRWRKLNMPSTPSQRAASTACTACPATPQRTPAPPCSWPCALLPPASGRSWS